MLTHTIRRAVVATAILLSFAAQAETELLLSTFFPATHPLYSKILVPWAKDVETATQGRVKVAFAAASLAPPPGQLDMVQKGIADVTVQFAGVVPNRMQPELLTELPGPAGSAVAASKALWATHERFFKKDSRYKGTELLSLFVFPAQYFFCVKECFTKIDQFRSAKIATGPGTSAQQFGALTSGVVAGPAVRYFEVVSKGIVDAYAAATPIDVYAFNLAPSTKGVLLLKDLSTAGSFALVVNSGKWSSIGKADKAAIQKLSGEAFAERTAVLDAASESSLKKLVDSDVKMITADDTLNAELKKAWAFLDSEWVDAAKKRGIDGAAALSFYREQVRK